MKEIRAVIQPLALAPVVEALQHIDGLPDVTVERHVCVVRRFRSDGPGPAAPGDLGECVPMVRLQFVVPDAMVEAASEAIETSAHIGDPGNGTITVSRVDGAIGACAGE